VRLLAVAVAGRGLVDPDAPVFGADDEALLRGSAAFETLRVDGGRPFLLERHLERLRHSARALALPPPDGAEELVALVLGAAPAEHVLRIYRTERALVATAAPLPDDLDELRARGLTLQTVEAGASTLLHGVKSTSYAEAFAARRAVAADDALFLAAGVVRETATANIWWRRGETLYTPAEGLPGVTRGHLLERHPAVEGTFRLDDLTGADEAFTTSSVREVMPVVAVDGMTVGDGRPGPAAARLQALLRLPSVT
jgi:branched-subunit amino acid aminotransferase/4-amino-4-deoxychorismate lyase